MNNYPPGFSKADYDHVEGNDGGYSDWVNDNIEELEADFLLEGWLEKDLGTPRFDVFCWNRWERIKEDE